MWGHRLLGLHLGELLMVFASIAFVAMIALTY